MANAFDPAALCAKLPFWPALSPVEQAQVCAAARLTAFAKGQAIHRGEGDCVGLLALQSGCIRVYITSEEGREVTLYRLEAGEVCILSAACVLDTISFEVSVEAETDCTVLQLSAAVLARLSAQNDAVALFAHRLANERFSDVMWTMQQLLFARLDQRLAAFLLDESARQGSLELAVTHEQIAKHLGSAREVVSRMLKYFSQEGYVTLSRGGVRLCSKAALRALL